MLFRFLICSTLIYFVVADVQFLSREHLPSSKQEGSSKLTIAADPLDFSNNEIVTNDLKQNNRESLKKNTENDPAYANFPLSYNGYPTAFPNQVYPGHVYLPPAYQPHYGLPPLGRPMPGYPPYQGFPKPGHAVQFYPGHGYPPYGLPAPGFMNPYFPVPGQPNYPVYFSHSEQLNAEKENEDDKLRVRGVLNSGTQYDETNGGYLYKTPSVTF